LVEAAVKLGCEFEDFQERKTGQEKNTSSWSRSFPVRTPLPATLAAISSAGVLLLTLIYVIITK
jgi:hypothetical protein